MTVGSFVNEITREYDTEFYSYFNPSPAFAPLTGPFQVSLAGRQYAIDLSFKPYRRDAYRHRSLPNSRESLNYDNIPGEGVIDTSGLWRRNGDDWSLGAGQLYFDHRKSADNRFLTSKGVDPFTTQWQLTLLNDTVKQFSMQGGGTFIKPLMVGKYQYFLEQDKISFIDTTVGYGTVHALTGLPSVGAGHYFSDICCNGQFVFVACGTNGIYYWPVGSTGGAVQYVIQTAATSTGDRGYTFTQVAWAADVLWSTGQHHVYVFGAAVGGNAAGGHSPGSAASATTESLPDVVGGGWVWSNIIGANSQVYLGGGYQAGASFYGGGVYRVGQLITNNVITNVTTTTFAAPVRCLQMTPGEYCTALFPFLNYIFVGSNLGVRMCRTLSQYDPTAASTGDLEGGALIPDIEQPVTSAVTSFTAQGRFVYFAWCNYDTVSTGIGKMDVQNFIDDLTPAYCSDHMVTGQSTQLFLEWDIIQNAPMIALSNPGSGTPGVYMQSPNLVPLGTLNTGWVTYGVPDDKALIKGQFFIGQGFGGLKMFIATDDSLGNISGFKEVHSETADANDMGEIWFLDPYLRGNKFQYQIELTREPTATTTGPTLSRWTMWGQPVYVASETTVSIVIILFRHVNVGGQIVAQIPYEEYHFLDTLRREQTIVEFVEGPLSAQVVITSIDWLPEQHSGIYQRGFQSDAVVYLQTINGFTYTPEPTE